MIKTKHIDEFKIGQNIHGFYQSTFKEKKISKNGDIYIDLSLRDSTGQINAKIWDFSNFYESAFNEGDLVAVKGEVKRYRSKLFLEIKNISFLDPERYKQYGFNSKNIYPDIGISKKIIFNKIKKIINLLNSPYKSFLLDIYSHYEYEIKNFPDDLSVYQYNMRGALILKIYNTIKIAKNIFKDQKHLNKDLIISGILLKYIGRVNQYKYDIVFKLTEMGSTEDCFILSRDIIKKFSNKHKINQKFINNLVDIILYNYDSDEVSKQNYNGEIVHMVFQIEKSLSFANIVNN